MNNIVKAILLIVALLIALAILGNVIKSRENKCLNSYYYNSQVCQPGGSKF